MEKQRYSYFIIEDATSRNPKLVTDSHGFLKYFNTFEDAEFFIDENKLYSWIICDEIITD